MAVHIYLDIFKAADILDIGAILRIGSIIDIRSTENYGYQYC